MGNRCSGPARRRECMEMAARFGRIVVRTFRNAYGPHFAPRLRDDEPLSSVLEVLDEDSLDQLLRDFNAGALARRIKDAFR